MSPSNSVPNEQDLPTLTPRQRAAANARAHRKPGFSPEGLERLRDSALKHRAWEKSTGPTSAAGKARSSRNSFKHGHRALIDLFRQRRLEITRFLVSLDPQDARQEISAAIQTLRDAH